MDKTKFWVHGLLFNIVWFLCVVQQSTVLTCGGLLAWWLVSPVLRAEGMFIGIVATAGIVIDSLFTLTDWFAFGNSESPFIPIWLMLLWLGFSRFVYCWLTQIKLNHVISACIFAILGPVNYWIGEGFDAVTIHWSMLELSLAFVVWWACLIPFAVRVMQLCNKPLPQS